MWEKVYTSNANLQNNAGEYILTAANGSYVVYVDSQSEPPNTGTGGNMAIMILNDDVKANSVSNEKKKDTHAERCPNSTSKQLSTTPGKCLNTLRF